MPLLRLERTLAKPELATKKSPQVSTNAKKSMGHGLVSLVHLTTACTFTKKYNPWFFYSEVVPKNTVILQGLQLRPGNTQRFVSSTANMEVLFSHVQLIAGCLATPARIHSISGLKSRVLKLTFLA